MTTTAPSSAFPSQSATPTTPSSVRAETTGSISEMSSSETVNSSQGVQSTTPSMPDPQIPTSSESSTAARSTSTTARASEATGSITQRVLTTIVSVSGSSTITSVSVSSQVVAADSASATSAPGLNGSNGGGGSSGLSSTSKKIIGGVIGGVGSAILLGGLVVVAWRIWGRRRKLNVDGDDLMDSHPGSSGREKTSSVSDPFRSHLDQTHAPVNTASNF